MRFGCFRAEDDRGATSNEQVTTGSQKSLPQTDAASRGIPGIIQALRNSGKASNAGVMSLPINDEDVGEHPAVAAWRKGTLALGFSGGGFLLPYFIGEWLRAFCQAKSCLDSLTRATSITLMNIIAVSKGRYALFGYQVLSGVPLHFDRVATLHLHLAQ